jgi:hypothetical protein
MYCYVFESKLLNIIEIDTNDFAISVIQSQEYNNVLHSIAFM